MAPKKKKRGRFLTWWDQRPRLTNPLKNTAKKAEKTLSEAEKLIKGSEKAIKIGTVVFVTAMGLSIVSSVMSIKIATAALKKY